jgi:hypothetical protein
LSKIEPPERYKQLAVRLRDRIEFAELVLKSSAPAWQKAESLALQLRKSIETVAHMSLVATEHGLGELGVPKDIKRHWNAETIFKRLKQRGFNILPSPSRMQNSSDPRFKAVFAGVPEYRLSYDDLIEMYQWLHNLLHDDNPYRALTIEQSHDTALEKLSTLLVRIKNFTWIHFIGIRGEAFAVDLRNIHGETAVLPLKRIAAAP